MTIWIQYTKLKQLVAFNTVFQTLESLHHKARTKNGPENNVLLWSHKPKKFLHSEGIFNVQRFEVFVECVIFSTKDDPHPPKSTHVIIARTLGYIIFAISDHWPIPIC